ncbi:uncharacterized protein LOC127264694 [Andrographis paniculata]|uniref:uncharacterized protein LOC127264694 n=1 Tax=Andrographis paniculata TaxID=175694 RepID=UPI0021E742FE|nr:uncharacterized protein LOC127264694 [Andrographis paniculata]
MVEGGGAASYPVIFFDGERESDLGDVNINPRMEYKAFQVLLSQKIGISPNQISIYMVDRKRIPEWPFSEDRRRIPITAKVNFGAISRLKDCYFLVVLKRSRKSRNHQRRGLEFYLENNNHLLPRRNLQGPPPPPPLPFYDEIAPTDLAALNFRLQNQYHDQREMRMGLLDFSLEGEEEEASSYSYLNIDSSLDWRRRRSNYYCEECANEENNRNSNRMAPSLSFHPCINDAVIIGGGFRTTAGPIRRPLSRAEQSSFN